MIKCSYFPECNACNDWDTPYSLHKDKKIAHLQHLLNENNLTADRIDFISAGEHSLRHKADFVYQFKNAKSHFGFYTKNRDLIDIEHCLQMSPALQKAYDIFRSLEIKVKDTFIKKGSVRLRVNPKNQFGCWLDFSNIDIKLLLDDGVYFKQLLQKNFKIEVGQKKKQVTQEPDGSLKLKYLPPELWFQSFDQYGKPLDINCHISSFTQPSWISGQKLIESIQPWLFTHESGLNILEFGSGVGFFTAFFLSAGHKVTALEIEESAFECLKANIPNNIPDSHLNVITADFHRTQISPKTNIDIAFVNPARAGFKKFYNSLLQIKSEKIIYVSCFPESMANDLKNISKDYKLRNIIIVDQFPQTRHYETCVFLEKLL
jgi:tRNA/tmRNA/rRNA uracil-C5-methylase (TrmA/RlmC/RlmD family)